MASKVVSTKLTEEEYGKLVGLCSKSGYTVSKLLKRAILERMNEQPQTTEVYEQPKAAQKTQEIQKIPEVPVTSKTAKSEERFLYY